MASQPGPSLSHHFATSADGAQLSYYSTGNGGPNVLILHGAICYALSHQELARALSANFTVHTASSRSRGLSAPYPAAVTDLSPYPSGTGHDETLTLRVGKDTYKSPYNPAFTAAVISTELADLEALVQATGAEFLIGVSSGALVALDALRPANLDSHPGLATLKGAVIFEPPLFFSDRDSPADLGLLARFEEDKRSGDEVGAMVTAMQLVELGPAWIPRWLMKWLSGMMMRGQEKSVEKEKQAGGEDRGKCTMRELGAALRYDFAVCSGVIGDSARFAHAGERREGGGGGRVEVLLLHGGRSPRYLQEAMGVLAGLLPGAKHVTIEGVGHEVLCGADMRGQPDKAVPAIRDFFQGVMA